MAFGNYSNSKGGDIKSPSVYGRYNFTNSTSIVDKTRLYSRFWNGSLIIGICPKTPDSTDEQPRFDNRNGVEIFLNHTKALMLYRVITEFMKDPDGWDNSGVEAGKGLITISRGKEFGAKAPIIVIRQVDQMSGTITASFAYETKSDKFFSIKGFDEKNPGKFEQVFYPNMELEQLLTLLDQYVKAETRAVAYTVYDAMNFEFTRLQSKVNRIGEKLGLDMSRSSEGSGGARSSGSFFTRAANNSSPSTNAGATEMDDDFGAAQYTSATLDDIE